MDVSTFHTQQISAKAGKGAGSGNSTLNGNQGLFAAGITGVNFMDLIFARSVANTATAQAQTGEGENDGKDTLSVISLINKDDLSAEEIAVLDETLARLKENGILIESGLENLEGQTDSLSSQQILKSILQNDPESFTAPDTKTNLESGIGSNKTAIKNLKDLNEFLRNMLAGLPEYNRPVIAHINSGATLQFDSAANTSGESLIATGLSISDLTQLIENISNGDEQGEALVIGTVNILPPNGKKEAVFTPRGVIIPQAVPQVNGDSLAAKLTSLLSGTQDADSTTIFGTEGKDAGETDFESILKVLERAQAKAAANGQTPAGLEKAIERIQQLSAGNSAIQLQNQNQTAASKMSEIFAAFQVNDIFPEGFDFLQGANQTHGQSLNTALAQITSLITNVQQAGHPHPASQAVAQVMAKTSGQGENRNFTIQLDPPELGRVQIKLEFSKNKAMKAHMVVEKPETHLMLQRDSQLLERALQDMGVDTDDGSLSFELSQDGNLFDHDQKDQGGNSGNGSGGAESNAEDDGMVIIETSVDWQIDPNTGHTSYNLLV